MAPLDRTGQRVLGAALVAFGVTNAAYADGVQGLEPLPAWLPAHALWAYATGALLAVAGLALLADRRAGTAARAAAAMVALWLLALHLPALAAHPRSGGAWTTTLETLALGSAAWLVADAAPRRRALARATLGAAVVGFGMLHFIYHAYVASVIPAWIPGHLAWTYATGVAFLAAGASLLTGVRARLAATLLGAMFGSWVLLVHAPRVARAPHERAEWTSLVVALAMCGGAWASVERERTRAAEDGRVEARAA